MSNKINGITRKEPGRVLNVGHGNFVLVSRMVAILESGSLPTKRFREKAQEKNLCVDATAGRKMRSLVILDSGHVVLSALATQTLHERLETVPEPLTRAHLEYEVGEFVS